MRNSKEQIIVLGSKGMLGQMVKKYFSSSGKYNVITYDERFTEKNYAAWGKFLSKYTEAAIINCIGIIKQKTADPHKLAWTNALLPLAISDSMHSNNYLIQPSTDCVFDGKKGTPYARTDKSDAVDAYGWSKRMSEVALLDKSNCVIVRVSIIGPDNSSSAKGLLSWFLSNPDKTKLFGYSNHLWNGITTLEWAKQVENIISNNRQIGLIQLGSEKHCSKYEMLNLFKRFYGKDVEIVEIRQEQDIDRRLIPDIVSQPLENQMLELINFTL